MDSYQDRRRNAKAAADPAPPKAWAMYKVLRGETYYSISDKFQMTLEHLKEANKDQPLISAGKVIRVWTTDVDAMALSLAQQFDLYYVEGMPGANGVKRAQRVSVVQCRIVEEIKKIQGLV